MSERPPPCRVHVPVKAPDPLAFPAFTRPRRIRAELVAGILRGGRLVPDEAFDEIYPEAVAEVSPSHWTPVRVCARAVELLRLPPGARVLDAGAGVGKFCIIAAAMMSRAHVRGVERCEPFSGIAREAARRLGIDVEISNGDFNDEKPHRVDAVYFFNPFTETILLSGLKHSISPAREARQGAADIAAAERFLATARTGLRVITYCGFGGAMPPEYTRLAQETWDGNVLELWEKSSVGASQR